MRRSAQFEVKRRNRLRGLNFFYDTHSIAPFTPIKMSSTDRFAAIYKAKEILDAANIPIAERQTFLAPLVDFLTSQSGSFSVKLPSTHVEAWTSAWESINRYLEKDAGTGSESDSKRDIPRSSSTLDVPAEEDEELIQVTLTRKELNALQKALIDANLPQVMENDAALEVEEALGENENESAPSEEKLPASDKELSSTPASSSRRESAASQKNEPPPSPVLAIDGSLIESLSEFVVDEIEDI
jgi:hypothetical protein